MLELMHSCMVIQIIYRYAVILGGRTPNGPNNYVGAAAAVPEVLVTALVQVRC